MREELQEGDDSLLQIALGSATETESHLLIAADFGYLDAQARETLLGEIKTIQRMLAKLAVNLP